MLLELWLLHFLPFARGLSVNVPTNPFAGTTVSVTWTFNSTDPASFVLDLHAHLLSLDRVLNTVNTTAQSADVDITSDEHGKEWTLRALGVTDNQQVLAESPQFSITAGPAPTVSTSSSAFSSPSATPAFTSSSTAVSSSGASDISSSASSSSGLGGVTQPSTTTPQNKSSNTGAIVGAVIGTLVALGFLIFLIVFLVLRRRRRTQATLVAFSPFLPTPTEPTEIEGRLVEAPQLRQVQELSTAASSFTESSIDKAGALGQMSYTVARLKAENVRLNNLLQRDEGSELEQPPSYDVASSSS